MLSRVTWLGHFLLFPRAMRVRCVESIGPLIAALTAELPEKELRMELPVLEKVRRHLDTHRR